jgi:hypothetical protein
MNGSMSWWGVLGGFWGSWGLVSKEAAGWLVMAQGVSGMGSLRGHGEVQEVVVVVVVEGRVKTGWGVR